MCVRKYTKVILYNNFENIELFLIFVYSIIKLILWD